MQNLILNRYRPISTAGKGGYATVQVAWDTRIQRRVAIKCLPLASVDPDSVGYEAPGLSEARTAAMLIDPAIVGVLDFEIEGEMAYLIMEYVDGITLTQLMRQEGMLSIDAAACVFDAVSHALEAAHDNLVLHLDIKPDNVLINRQGQVKVTDFGLAELSHEAGFGRAAGGTIGYMPIEQMRLESPDKRTDEWALAALTYQMLTGDNPFYADTLSEAERAIEEAEIVIPSQVRGDVSPELDDVLFHALTIEREGRFDTVKEFSGQLMPYLGDVRRGKRELARIVGDATDDAADMSDEASEDDGLDMTDLDGLGGRAAQVAPRLFSLAACLFLVVVSLGNMPRIAGGTGSAALAYWAVVGVAAAVALLLPAAGSLVALAAFSAALFMTGAYGLGSAVAVVGAVWWLFIGRRGRAPSLCLLAAPLAGGFGVAAFAPMACGCELNVKEAAATAAASAVLCFCLACAGSFSLAGWDALNHLSFGQAMDTHAVALLSDPAIWLAAASWVVAAAVLSFSRQRGSFLLFALGIAAATAILSAAAIGGLVLGGGFVSHALAFGVSAPALAAGVLAFAVALARRHQARSDRW